MPRAAVLLLLLTACDAPSQPVGAPPPLGSALARVDGQLIERTEVEQLARSAGISPARALHHLVSERLLVAHALRAGYGGRAEVRRAEAQALVRALLARELGAGVESDPARVEGQRTQLERLLRELATRAHVHYDDAVIARVFDPENEHVRR
jgi:hypothetical protein